MMNDQNTKAIVREQSKEVERAEQTSGAAQPNPVTPEVDTVQSIPIKNLLEFKGHAFKPYSGKRLDQLAQSISENGVMQPVIVRPTRGENKFEIVSGHNRTKAATKAKLTAIPAIVRKMSDNEAAILANETNVTQRSFKDWLPSEKAKSIHQYHEAVKRQGRRSSKKADASGANSQKEDGYARTKTAKVYGVKENIIRLYLNIYRLAEDLLEKLDNGEFGVSAAQALSFISPGGQSLLTEILEGDKDSYSVTVANAQEVRNLLKNYNGDDPDEKDKIVEDVRRLLNKELFYESGATGDKIKNIPLDADLYEELFLDSPVDVAIEMIKAAMQHFLEGDANVTADETADPSGPQDPLTSESVNNSENK